MLIVGFVPDPESAASIIGWCRRFEQHGAETDEVQLLCWERSGSDGRTREAVLEALGDSVYPFQTITSPDPLPDILEYCRSHRVGGFVSHAFQLPGQDPMASVKAVVRALPCKVFMPIFGERGPDEVKEVLVLAAGTTHDRFALELALGVTADDEPVTLAIVEQDLGAGTAEAGQRELDALVHEMAVPAGRIETKVVVDSLPVRGILRAVEDQDLVLVAPDFAERFKSLEEPLGGITVAVVKRAPPLQLRSLPGWIPRINPSDYGELVQNLRQGSRWDADFVMMLGLAAAIASLGLLQDSPAVVIGSMLLAPLMTPMIGLGLALAQANTSLMRLCVRSIGLGFALTLGISLILGLITPSERLTPEILARGTPNVLDLGIALGAAVAASFALARPGIAGAIAGVAIATALVPPLCSIGLSLAEALVSLPREWGEDNWSGRHAAWNAVGATTLFVTNLVAIIFASFLTFKSMGVTNKNAPPRDRKRASMSVTSLVVLIVILAVPLRAELSAQVKEGRPQALGSPLAVGTISRLQSEVAKGHGERDVELILAARSNVTGRVYIWIASDQELPKSYSDRLIKIVREESGVDDQKCVVFAVRLVWKAGFDTAD